MKTTSKPLILRWMKPVLFILIPLVLILTWGSNYVIGYYAKALTQAGGWSIMGSPADVGLGSQFSGWDSLAYTIGIRGNNGAG